jgi:hypothetical protein
MIPFKAFRRAEPCSSRLPAAIPRHRAFSLKPVPTRPANFSFLPSFFNERPYLTGFSRGK